MTLMLQPSLELLAAELRHSKNLEFWKVTAGSQRSPVSDRFSGNMLVRWDAHEIIVFLVLYLQENLSCSPRFRAMLEGCLRHFFFERTPCTSHIQKSARKMLKVHTRRITWSLD